jgi:tRNA-Thr(GGU) m(6)t(6)A37 methyltransferase TsaA
MKIEYSTIGIIHSEFKQTDGMPIQPSGADGILGTIELFEEFVPGLKDLDGFSHIILIYHFHKSLRYKLEVVPFLDDQPHGLFATRAPKRPNQIGLSVVKLIGIKNNIIEIGNIDVLDGTPLLDIKPYITEFDSHSTNKEGWIEKLSIKSKDIRADNRFI